MLRMKMRTDINCLHLLSAHSNFKCVDEVINCIHISFIYIKLNLLKLRCL